MLLYVSATNYSHLYLQRATVADEEEGEGARALISAIHGTLYVMS